jgi:hypothetical protein
MKKLKEEERERVEGNISHYLKYKTYIPQQEKCVGLHPSLNDDQLKYEICNVLEGYQGHI